MGLLSALSLWAQVDGTAIYRVVKNATIARAYRGVVLHRCEPMS